MSGDTESRPYAHVIAELSPSWPVLRVILSEGDVDLGSGELWHLGATGIVEQPLPSGDVELVAGFPTAASAGAAGAALRARSPEWHVRIEIIDGSDWLDTWREHFEPLQVGRILIVPAWKTSLVEPRPDDIRIELDPGHAFGTGAHASTRLALTLLQDLPLVGRRVLDAGCGSGVLSIAAAMLGAARVDAVDIEQEAVRVTTAEAARNGLSHRVQASLSPVSEIDGPYDVIVANILAPVLIELAPALVELIHPDGCIIVAGLIDTQLDRVLEAYAPLTPVSTVDELPWLGLQLRRH